MQSSAPYRPPLPRRSQANNGTDNSDRCPFIGSAADPGTSLAFSSDANQCFSTRLPVPISTIHQENYCLSAKYETCPVYREHEARAAGSAALLPLTAVGVAAAGGSPAWSASGTVKPSSEAGVAASMAMAPAAVPATKPSLLFPWEEQAHPDFQADIASATARRRSARVNLRPVLIALLLLALIPLAWWVWTAVRPDSGDAGESAGGTVITLPTVAASSAAGDSSGGGSGTGSLPQATPTAGEASIGGAVATAATATPLPATALPEPTATLSDLARIAATATALFQNATAAPECSAPAWWVSYRVEDGDTIDALANARGITPEEMIAANCLTGPDLTPGMMLLLPPVGLIAIQPEQPTATATATTRATSTAVATRVTRLPTRPPILFPSPTFPVVIILPTSQPPTMEPTDEPTDEPQVRPTNRPTTAPTSIAPPTATPPNPFPTATPPGFATSTPPGSDGGTVTPTTTGTPGPATATAPAPLP